MLQLFRNSMSLKIKNLSKQYDDNHVINDISFEILKGEVFCIFGVLSVGKSVLIRTVAGLETPEHGAILLDENDLTGCNCEERGFTFPDVSNETFWKTLFNTNKRSELGDGEGQVLALENAIKDAENVLLLDNSFCQMDRKTRQRNYDLIKKVTKEKQLIVLFATNDYEEVFKIADRVGVLNKGSILQIGTPKEVYQHPNSKAVAEVFGDYNLIDAKRLTTGNKADEPEFVTVVGEHRISTGKVEKEKLGEIDQTFVLAIRPENISISFGASFPEDNLIKATISEINFQGSTTLIKLNANGLELKALVLRLVGLNIGDECMVGLPPDRILVLRDQFRYILDTLLK